MHGRAALVVHLKRAAARHRRTQDVAAVQHVLVRRRVGRDACVRQRAVAQQDGAGGDAGRAGRGLQGGLEVDVEGRVGALAQGGFHGAVVAVGGPGGVDSARGALVAEADAGVGVRCHDGGELRRDHGVGDVIGGGGRGAGGVGDDVEVGVDCVVGICCLAGEMVVTVLVVVVFAVVLFHLGGVPELIVKWFGLVQVGV